MNKKKNITNIPRHNLQQKKQQQRKSEQIQQQDKQSKKISNEKQLKNRNLSKIPIKQKPQDSKPPKNSSRDKSQKSLKEMVQIQIFTDPTNIELTKKKQKQCEEQIKKQIEKSRQNLMNSINENESTSGFQFSSNEMNDFSDSIKENEKIKDFNNQCYSNLPICEDPFIADLEPGSLFDKSTVKTPIPGFSIRKNYNLNKLIPTFPDDPNDKFTDTRLDSASEAIYPDGHRIFYNGNINDDN